MSRNFENEYKKYAASTAPDLWNRIMDGIDLLESTQDNANTNRSEKSPTETYNGRSERSQAEAGVGRSESSKAKVVDISVSERYTNFEQDVPKSAGNKTISINTFMSRYGGAIAATACGVIGLMLASSVMPRGCGSSATSDYTAAPAAPAMEAATAAEEAAADYSAKETANFDEAKEAADYAASETESYDEAEEAYDAYAYEAMDETSSTNADTNDASEVLTAGKKGADTNVNNKRQSIGSTKDQTFTAQSDATAEGTENTADEAEAYVAAEEPAAESGPAEDAAAATTGTGTQTTGKSATTAEKEDQVSTAGVKAAIKSVTGSKGHIFCELIVKDSNDSGLKEGSVIRAKVDENLEDRITGLFKSSDETTEYSINLQLDPRTKMYILSNINN
ncbi:MAG: hypothetical protein K6E53_00020 [Lachnospiraceae bacterium]|nr:hypothetical protein [Lachnospiraceae bacterium]